MSRILFGAFSWEVEKRSSQVRVIPATCVRYKAVGLCFGKKG